MSPKKMLVVVVVVATLFNEGKNTLQPKAEKLVALTILITGKYNKLYYTIYLYYVTNLIAIKT